jgi:hypothetical protein
MHGTNQRRSGQSLIDRPGSPAGTDEPRRADFRTAAQGPGKAIDGRAPAIVAAGDFFIARFSGPFEIWQQDTGGSYAGGLAWTPVLWHGLGAARHRIDFPVPTEATICGAGTGGLQVAAPLGTVAGRHTVAIFVVDTSDAELAL